MRVGYARVSSTGQSLDVQLVALEAAACERVFSEKVTGTSTKGRDALKDCLGFVREGDVLVITRIDRLARSVGDLEGIVATLKAKGVGLQATEQSIDTTTPAGMAFFQMLGVFAQFETAIRKERQREGIDKAKAAGVYKGRKRAVDPKRVNELLGQGMKPGAVAKELGCSRMTVYRLAE